MYHGRFSNYHQKDNHDLLVEAVINDDIDNILKLTKIIPESDWRSTIFKIPNTSITPLDEATKKPSRALLPETDLSLLHIAAYEDSLEAFLLLDRIPINIQSANGYLPIHYACSNGSKEVLTYILSIDESQAKIDYHTNYNLLQVATLSESPDLLKILFDYGAKLDNKGDDKDDPINIAIKRKNVECLKILLKHTSVSLKNYNQMTPIMLAIINSKFDAVPLLIDAKVDLGYINSNNLTALSIACMLGQKDIIKLICSKLDNIDLPPDVRAPAAVHWLCQSKDPEIAEIILSKNIDVNRVDHDDNVGPHYLLDAADPSTIIKFLELLVNAGFKIDYSTEKNTFLGECVTSIQLHPEVVDWLLEHGANIYAPLVHTSTPGLTIAKFILENIKKNINTSEQAQSKNNKLLKKIAQKWLPEEYKKMFGSSE